MCFLFLHLNTEHRSKSHAPKSNWNMHREILEGQLGISGRERYQKGLIPHAVKKTIDLGYFPYVTENKKTKRIGVKFEVFLAQKETF